MNGRGTKTISEKEIIQCFSSSEPEVVQKSILDLMFPIEVEAIESIMDEIRLSHHICSLLSLKIGAWSGRWHNQVLKLWWISELEKHITTDDKLSMWEISYPPYRLRKG